MTKKSFSRLQRDAEAKKHDEFLKNNTSWDELNSIHESINTAIAVSHSEFAKVIEQKEIYPYLEDRQNVSTSIRALSTDLVQLSSELAAIKALHEGKTGAATSTEDVMESIKISESYNLFNMRYQAVILPSINYVLQQFSNAYETINRLAAEKAHEESANNTGETVTQEPYDPATDPSVISDVQIKVKE